MAKKEKLRCDCCSKEAFEDETTDWINKLIPGKDFCSQKCASKYIKKDYVEDDDEVEAPSPDKLPELKPKKKGQSNDGAWELRNVPSQFTQALFNKESNEVVETSSALALILNKLDEILKRL